MLSRNNYQEKIRKMENKKERFSIRKFSIGAASVLIGFTLFGIGVDSQSVKADTVTPNSVNVKNGSEVNKTAEVLSNEKGKNATNTAVNTVKAPAAVQTKVNNNTTNNTSQETLNKSVANSQTENSEKKNLAASNQNNAVKPIVQKANVQATNSQTESVNDYSQFLNALQNKNVSTITLDKNIDFSNANLNNGSYQDINNYGIARTVTIDGQKQYSLNIGGNYIDLDSNTYYEPNASNPTCNWNVILKDLNLQTTSGYGPFWFNSATSNDSTLTFNGVTTSKDSGQLLNNSTASSYPNVNVNFEGENKLQGNLTNSNITSSALIQANNVNFSNGSTVFTANNNSSSNLADILASGNVVVDSSAQVDFNSEATSNMAGVSFANGAGNQTIDNATSGVLRLMPNAQVTMELGSGASMGVNNASNLDLQDSASLKITTSKMNSTGFRSAGLVGLDYDGNTNDSTVRISPNAVLSVIRTNVTDSDAPLLAMGPSSGDGEIYHLEVNDGSLNLQDSSYSSYLPSSYTLSKSQYWGGWPAILTMWGTSSQNYINFNNAKLINLQRTALNKPGYLIKTEGAGDYAYHQTHIVINSPDSAYNTPLTIIPAGETKPVTWNVKYLNNTSQGGDYAYAFRSYRDFGDWNNEGSEYMNGSVNDDTPAKGVNEVTLTAMASDPGSNSFSNGAVVPEGNETTASKALNSFINHFSWWNASGVKFGSNLDESNQYTPSYKPVNVEQGQTATDDPSFTNQDGKDITAPAGTTFTTGTDTPDWATINSLTGTVTVKPGTDVTPGAYNIPVTVTYPDTSISETTVPVIVTKAGQTVTWGDNGAVVTSVDTSKLNAHETTENSQVLSPVGVVTAEGYELTDGKLSTTATPITIDPSKVSWTTIPNTNVATATASGKDITTSVNVDFTDNEATKNILGSKNGVVTTNPFTIDAKGAGAKAVTAPVNIVLGSDLTSEQFSQLVDNNIPTDEIAKTEWATKPNEQGQGGVIKITFTDKAANGQPTYLNVNIPASSIKVTTDADENTPKGQDVSTKVGEVPDAEKGIENPGSLPSGTTYTWQNIPDTTKPGKKPAVVVVTYPDGSKDTVPTNVIVNAKPEIKTITTTVGGDPAATQGIANLNKGGNTPVDGYPTSATWTTKPDTSKPGATTGTATVTYPDGTTETVTIPVAVNGQGDVTVIDNGHVFSLHANDVVTHKTSDKNIIGGPVIENFKLSYYQGGQNYSKPYIYTLNADKTAYVLTQTGDNPSGVTVTAPQSINASDIKISWTEADTVLFNNALGAINGNGQPTSLASKNNGGTETITYTNWVNNQFGYPKYSAVVNSSSVNWPIYGKGPVSTYPFPSVYIYGAEANGTIPSVYSDTTDLKAALGDASKLVNTSDLTADHNAKFSSVDWQTLPSLDKANANASATVRINFTDGSYLDVPVSVNVIKVDQGIDNKTDHNMYHDITRTINVEGESTPVVQHVIYSCAKITDLSKPKGQQTSYTAWAPAKNSEGQAITNFPQYEVTKPGYTATATGATIETVDGKQYVPASGTITENSSNEVVNVTYTANEHTLVINYVDGNGTVVGTYSVPGKTDETVNVDVSGHVPTNWKLVPNQQVIGSYKFGSDDPQPVDYKVEHGTENVPVDKNNKNTYRKITQTIQEVPAGKTNADMTVVRMASFEFERTGVKDLVTGKTTWNAWNSNSETFPVYNIKEQKGYDSYVNGVKATEVAAVTVNPDSSNITDTITYVKQAATPVPYDPSNKDMNKSVTRTINYEVPAGHEAIAPVTQTVEYTRDVNGVAGYQDPVTGKITWNPWHVKSGKAEFASASVEQIKGYDSYVDGTKATEVAAAAVTEKDGEPQNGATVTVTYTANEHTLVINYVDGNGTVVGTYSVPGKTDETVNVDVSGHVPTNWKLVPNQQVIGSYKFGSDDPQPVDYKVEHGTKDITPTDPSVNPTDPKYKDMFTTVSRDIYQTKPGETETKIDTQHVDFGRNGVEDLVTGVVTGTGDWKVGKIENNTFVEGGKAEFASENALQIKGYDSYVDGIKSTEVPAASALKDGQPVDGAAVNVTYTANEHTLVINYVDGNGTVVGTYSVPGKTDETVNVDVSGHVPTNWKLVPNQQVIGSYKFGSDDPQPVDYKVEHGTKDITPTDPSVNPTDPKYKDMFTTVSRDIYQTKPGEAETKIDTQYVDFGRNGVEDLVTGVVTGTGDWKVVEDGKAEFASENAPQIKGYNSYVDGIKSTEVPAASALKDGQPVDGADVHITYVKQDSTPVPYDPSNKDMNRSVTRTIVVHEPGQDPVSHYQTVHFTNEDKDGNSGYIDPVTGKTIYNTVWHLAGDINQANGTWAEFNAPTVKGYTPSQAKVAAEEVTAETKDVTVDINYAPVAPTGQNVTTKVGEVPDAGQGIANKGDLPDGTKYTWKDTPDVTTAGDKPATVVVTYPDGSKDEVPVTIHVTNPTTPTDADKYTPEGQDVNTKTGVVPDPAEGIKNKSDLPDGTKYTWKDTPDVTTAGDKPATVVVTYPDGSKDEVPVTIHVTNPTTPTDADKYTPEGQDVNTKTGVVPDPAEGIKNKSDLPDGTKYTWKDTPDVTTAGDKPATVVVTYPDGSKDEVPVTIHVTNPTTPTDADKYTPEGQDVNTKTGVVPDPAEGIKNKGDLPDGTKYTWEKTPDVTKPGESTGVIVVTYPDGSKDEVPVTIHVTNPTTPTDADKYTPEGQDVNTKTGVVPDPAEGIKNKGDLPDGTKYTWEKTPDVTKPGESTGVIVVTYPDGSKDEVPVTIHVTNPTTPTDADKYTPEGQDVNTKTGVVPDPAEGIKNKGDLPDGTKYTWEKTPDVTKPGESTGVIVVTYPDGSKDEVTVKVIVNTNNVTPETQPIHTTPGVLPNPADAIKNKDEMPAGTKYTWKEVPNVNTVGEHTGVITVTYPDGSSVDLTVKVYVDAVAKENNSNNTAQVITKHVAENNEKKTSATPAQQIKHSEKATLPQTGAKSENTAGILGLAIAAVGSLFGLGAGKKRRDK